MINQEVEAVKNLCDQIGYGNAMLIASALWKIQLIESGLSEEAASDAAFVPTCLPFLKKKWQKVTAGERDNMMRLIDNGKNA
jgi:hypothetical protein